MWDVNDNLAFDDGVDAGGIYADWNDDYNDYSPVMVQLPWGGVFIDLADNDN